MISNSELEQLYIEDKYYVCRKFIGENCPRYDLFAKSFTKLKSRIVICIFFCSDCWVSSAGEDFIFDFGETK